jgi:DNA (cytosine-5)-methyltransferase 1
MFTLADFCCGIGGFSLAFRNSDLQTKTVFANDVDLACKQAFDLNFDIKCTCCDILNLDVENVPDMDILTAGFPCQPFSVDGYGAGKSVDKVVRPTVFQCIINVIRAKRPRIVVFENMKHIISHDGDRTFATILKLISDSGYTYKYRVLNVLDHTYLPQNRERLFIVCFLNDSDHDAFTFPNDDEDCEDGNE